MTLRTRRGRPDGSVALTPEIERTILAYIGAGAFDFVAAEAAGIDARTFRDWIARGEGRHPTRSRTPKLRTFAAAVREAKAQARAAREIVVADKDPKFWLSHAARSVAGRDGWTEPVEALDEGGGGATYQPTKAELAETLRILVASGAIELEPCGDPECRCTHGSDDG